MVELLAGVALAAFLFAAFLWSVYRTVTTRGHTRVTALLLSLTTIFGMLAVTYDQLLAGQIAGGAIVVFAALAIWRDPGWSKLLPLVQLLFGTALIAGLPWMGA